MTVFEAFPNAVETWTLIQIQRGTEIGNIAEEIGSVRVIVADGDTAKGYNTPNADGVVADCLIYAMPEDLPTSVNKEALASYGLKDQNGFTYSILTIGTGKNQETGDTEHIEMTLKMTEFSDGNG